jgi:hypothetical protein
LRHNLHNRIGPHFLLVLDIGEPGGVQRGDAAIAAHQRDDARDIAAADELLHALGNQFQGRGIQRGLGGGGWKREKGQKSDCAPGNFHCRRLPAMILYRGGGESLRTPEVVE